jgi:hypothetical protein
LLGDGRKLVFERDLAGDVDARDLNLVPQITNGGVGKPLACAAWIHRQQAFHALDEIPRPPLRADATEELGHISANQELGRAVLNYNYFRAHEISSGS